MGSIKVRGRHRLANFLNDTFALVPHIWKRVLPVSLAALLPGAALWVAAIASLASFAGKLVGAGEDFGHDPALVLSGIVPFLWLCALAIVFLFLGASFQKAYTCAEAGAAIEGRKPRFFRSLRDIARRPFVRVAVQDAAIGALTSTVAFSVALAVFLPFLFGMIGKLADIGKGGGPGIGAIVLLVLVYFAAILIAAAIAWWIRVKTAVSAPATVLEDMNSLSGMGRSLDLVRGHGWRSFGVMFIVALVISFGLGILTGPVTFVVILPGYFSLLKGGLAGSKPSPQSIAAFLSSLSWAMGITMLISEVVKGGLWSAFLTLLHADLKARSGERPERGLRKPPRASMRALRGSRRRRVVEQGS